MTSAFAPVPFVLATPQSELDDLNSRIDHARWVEEVVPGVSAEAEANPGRGKFGVGLYGPSLALMREWAAEWRNSFSWREEEARLNTYVEAAAASCRADRVPSFHHFKVKIGSQSVHYIHHPSTRANAIPLVLCHGWPGSFLEFLDVIPLLTAPPAGEQAFHVVVPSMPGFGYSSAPPNAQFTMVNTAALFNDLMTGLGYDRYAAAGGDWGSITARLLGSVHAAHCRAVHLNFLPASAPGLLSYIPTKTLLRLLPSWLISAVDKERAEKAIDYLERGSAYYAMQAFTPRTPAYGLNDSPIGLLAWIGEKVCHPFAVRADRQMGWSVLEIEAAGLKGASLTRNAIYSTVTLYWLTSTIGTSFLPVRWSPSPHLTDQ